MKIGINGMIPGKPPLNVNPSYARRKYPGMTTTFSIVFNFLLLKYMCQLLFHYPLYIKFIGLLTIIRLYSSTSIPYFSLNSFNASADLIAQSSINDICSSIFCLSSLILSIKFSLMDVNLSSLR